MRAQDGDEDGGADEEAAAAPVQAAPKKMRSENPDYRQHASDRWAAERPLPGASAR